MNSKENKKIKVALGLSGGVDSSVAAYLLKQQGYDVEGIYMQCWDAKVDGCRADEDRADAVEVATKLGIKFKYLDFIKPYKEKVISYFYNEYQAGRTPNPDIICNKEIKFGLFLEWALANSYDFVATGHYARVQKQGEYFKLLRGLDESKDQSYFLYTLNQKHLKHTLFPLGEIDKSNVRDIAKQQGLHTYNKPDSVGICFIGEVDMKDFLSKKIDKNSGILVNSDGEEIGTHDGLAFYTIGQRHGFNATKYHSEPLYVISKNFENNELVVGYRHQAFVTNFEVRNLSWSFKKFDTDFEALVRIRHLGELYNCKLVFDKNSDSLKVKLENPVFGLASGQSAVFYLDDVMLGGGVIV